MSVWPHRQASLLSNNFCVGQPEGNSTTGANFFPILQLASVCGICVSYRSEAVRPLWAVYLDNAVCALSPLFMLSSRPHS
jgi:hypothetical protein